MIKQIGRIAAHVLHPRLAWRVLSDRRTICKVWSLSWREAGELMAVSNRIDDNVGEGWAEILRRGTISNGQMHNLNSLQQAGLIQYLAEISDPQRGNSIQEIIECMEAYTEQMARAAAYPPARPEQRVNS